MQFIIALAFVIEGTAEIAGQALEKEMDVEFGMSKILKKKQIKIVEYYCRKFQ